MQKHKSIATSTSTAAYKKELIREKPSDFMSLNVFFERIDASTYPMSTIASHTANLSPESKPEPTVPLFFFDGTCAMCNGSVQFVFKRDQTHSIHFVPMQSIYGRSTLASLGINPDVLSSMYFLEDGKIYNRSDAVMRVAIRMGGIWRIIGWLGLIVPRFIRNAVYDYIARNRYRFFGTKETCTLPAPAFRERILT